MRRHPHRKGSKRQRKKREHGTRRQRCRIKPFRTKWAAICWARYSPTYPFVRAFLMSSGAVHFCRVLPEDDHG
jgi:hypothetical protein